MILTCPECATRYFVEDERLGAQGRTVRCAGCGNAWRAFSEEPLDLISGDAGAYAASEPLSFRPAEPVALEDLPADELPKAFRAKAQQQRRVREAATAGVVWAGMVCAFAVLLGGAYLFRVDVVKLYPRAAGAYAMAGVAVNPTGFEFEKVKGAPAADGLAAVTVTGLLRNVDDEPKAPPPLRVGLLAKGDVRLASRPVQLPTALIAPGHTIAFSVSLPDPQATAVDIDVNFDLEQMRRQAKAAQAAKSVKAGRSAASAKAPVSHGPTAAAKGPAAPSGLRPRLDASVEKAAEATPLAAGDPYALDSHGSKAVSARPHG